DHEYFGEQVREQLIYYPTVTREPYRNEGRLSDLMSNGKLFEDIGLPKPNLEDDRFMLCGSPAMLKDLTASLDDWWFEESRQGMKGHYANERDIVDKSTPIH